MPINPSEIIANKAQALANATGQSVEALAQGVAAELPNLAVQARDSLESAKNLRVLNNSFEIGDVEFGNSAVANLAEDVVNAGAGLLNSALGKGTAALGSFINDAQDKLTAATGIIDGATAALGQVSGFANKVGLQDALSSSQGVSESKVGINSQNKKTKPKGKNITIQNQLENYASFNCVFELGALSVNSINNPAESYRKNGADVTILRSGGGGINENRVRTIYEALGKEAGNLEYFIDDFEMSAIVAPSRKSGIAPATKLSFTVHEPYSMGLFLQALQAAALDAGFRNYLQAPYLLELDFVGWDDEGNAVPVEYANRKIPFKLSNIEFEVERGGSVYQIEAYPWNEVALLDEYAKIQDQISITGPSVLEAITTGPRSLSVTINNAIATAANNKNQPVSDIYLVRFPTSRTSLNSTTNEAAQDLDSAILQEIEQTRAVNGSQAGADAARERSVSTISDFLINAGRGSGEESPADRILTNAITDVNAIGMSKMVSVTNAGGDQPFGLGLYTLDEDTGIYKRDGVELEITGDTRTFRFEKGTKVTKVIEEMILVSEYGKAAMEAAASDEESMIPWFRIEPQVYVIDDWIVEEETGKKAKVWVYNVVQYEVASSTFTAPNQEVAVKERAKQVVKSYDYIYSGENKDVLGFDIKFNAAFFTAIAADFGELPAGERSGSAEGTFAPEQATPMGTGDGTRGAAGIEGQVVTAPTVRSFSGGTYNIDRGANLARIFHQNLINSDVDLITADLEIWGDPYFLHDSGMGNYNAEESNTSACLTADGCADYQRGHVHILVNFRTPIDYNRDGSMAFPEDTVAVQGFSGLYRVLQVQSSISGNQFKQTLKLIREKNQSLEGAADPNLRRALQANANVSNSNTQNDSPPNEQTGVARDSSIAAASRAAARPLSEDGPLKTVSSSVNPQFRAQVAELVAENFQALIDDLEQTYGYEINAMGGYSARRAVGSQNWSYHASGLALDFNYAENGIVKPRPEDAPEPTDMPLDGTGSAMEALAAKHGLGWGGAWNSLTDSMHFSAAKKEFGYLDWPRNGIIPGAAEQPAETLTAEVSEPPAYEDAILRQQRTQVSGTQAVTQQQATTAQNQTVAEQQAAGTPTTAEQQALAAQTGNTRSSFIRNTDYSGLLRPYYQINAQDDRYDYNTGDKVRAILAARNQR